MKFISCVSFCLVFLLYPACHRTVRLPLTLSVLRMCVCGLRVRLCAHALPRRACACTSECLDGASACPCMLVVTCDSAKACKSLCACVPARCVRALPDICTLHPLSSHRRLCAGNWLKRSSLSGLTDGVEDLLDISSVDRLSFIRQSSKVGRPQGGIGSKPELQIRKSGL